MNNYFIDTSALFKRYITEKGTDQLDEIFSLSKYLYISDLTIVEMVSNLKRKNEIVNEIDRDLYLKIKKEFFNDIAQGNIQTISVSSEIIIKALDLIDKKYITPMDSVQLATAIQLNSKLEDVVFVCSDKKLAKLAEEYEIKNIVV